MAQRISLSVESWSPANWSYSKDNNELKEWKEIILKVDRYFEIIKKRGIYR